MNDQLKKPKVSICVVTYNQEKYIRQCLQSIVDQKTNFDFEVIVGDDCSTDNTPDIVLDFWNKYPNIIIPILNKKNLGPTRNYIQTHLRARGEYIAHMDGDDFSYPGKLRIQANYLDLNNNLVLIWHGVDVVNNLGHKRHVLSPYLNTLLDATNITQRDVLKYGSLGAACSLMYRKSAGKFLSDISVEVLDYYIALKLLESGNAARLLPILGAYRYDDSAITSSKNTFRYFIGSSMRTLYAKHLNYFYIKNKDNKDVICLNAFFYFLVELRFLRTSSLMFLILSIRTFTFSTIFEMPKYLIDSLKLRSK